jgi:hypothetical protein
MPVSVNKNCKLPSLTVDGLLLNQILDITDKPRYYKIGLTKL